MAEKMTASGDLSARVAAYFDACNSGDREAFFALFRENATHYLPKGMFGPFGDVQSLFDQWRRDAVENGAYWVADRIYADPGMRCAVAEWTAVKPGQSIYFRGVDVFDFDEAGLITQVRVYYASPRDPSIGDNELGGYDYSVGGWHDAADGPPPFASGRS